ncbi:hypothetical protein HYQ59_1872 [Lactobacillus crispatus]|uniref:hypothetical protein n=1 Tax=Lactobacillus crispatus TaxID=47770 RepID=UPI0018E2A949|nr:hypothetical protein [Lactobacillus crispatus]MBI1700520.1 hypothetical protein [Lactobacillus crispatus]
MTEIKKDWHDFYRANTKRWCVPDGTFVNVGVKPVVSYVYINGQATKQIKSLGYWVIQRITLAGKSNLKRYTNPILVNVDGSEPIKLEIGDLVQFDGLKSYYVKGFKRGQILYRGHVNFRADRLRKVG